MTFSNSLFLSSLGYNYFENTFVTLKPLLFDDKTLLFPKYLFYKSKSILKKEKNSNILIIAFNKDEIKECSRTFEE
ncbi:hypothetical protein DDB_G0294202 [Dictyostelium discoideum AX4]|uniref:Uncharacterized protein n=1 Tax=Dictyostelium discoideum TaxID=44689 RepID=Q54AU5_DICDI|nr:hypothetical protein DDB_G0294202 [Dictyostelium discoideum AX4]EAL60388.1 hypothetical protein DDB_G0294202 [Dictyostelium discoideum AX4]|eukprot:XP_628801.1 hypothetical protein DDB_G0294202 [Dictyostelium discoideum AX4]